MTHLEKYKIFPKPLSDFLYTDLLGKGIIDLWLIIHYLTGILTFFLVDLAFNKLSRKYKFLIVFIIIILAEIIELYTILEGSTPPEPLLNVFLDIGADMLGAYTLERIYNKFKKN